MTYSKPDFYVTEFAADRAFATGCTSQNNGYETVYIAQQVTCIVDGSEWIFTSGTSGCTSVVDVNSSSTTWYFKTCTIDGLSYFVWYDGEVNAQPNTYQQSILDDLGITGQGWHAGTYTTSLYELLTASY